MTSAETLRRRVLITGAGGTIGRSLSLRLKDRYELRLHHRTRPEDAGDADIVTADIRNYDQVRAVMDGVDTVFHLAGDPAVPASWESVYENNILGTRNVLEAAREAGARRVVFASTNHVMGMYDRDGAWPVYNDLPQRPDSLYGVSKVFGEHLGRHYYDAFGLEFIALRIGWFMDTPEMSQGVGRAMWLSPDDCAQVFTCATEADVPFGVFYAISDNPDRRWDITDTMLQLGYRPRDSWTRALGVGEDIVPVGARSNPEWPDGT
jgi:NAD+ dependent glucose-6-phosphate dehydrogenase